MGHDEQYLTRNLELASSFAPGPGKAAVDLTSCDEWHKAKTFQAQAKIEIDKASALFKSSDGGYDADSTQESPWPRIFCASKAEGDPKENGLLVMSDYGGSAKVSRNVPIWNVRTKEPIIVDHGDITNVRLLEFLRQVYVDTMFFR